MQERSGKEGMERVEGGMWSGPLRKAHTTVGDTAADRVRRGRVARAIGRFSRWVALSFSNFAVGGAVLSVSNVFEIGQDKAKSLTGRSSPGGPRQARLIPAGQVAHNWFPKGAWGGWLDGAWTRKTASPARERENDRRNDAERGTRGTN